MFKVIAGVINTKRDERSVIIVRRNSASRFKLTSSD